MKNLGLFVCLLFLGMQLFAQKNNAIIKGKVLDEYKSPLEYVSVSVKGYPGGTKTNDKGDFNLEVPADKNIHSRICA